MTQPLLQAADLRGAARLGTDAVAGLASLVETMHAGIASLPRLPGLGEAPRWEREAVVAALNGVIGDHLASTDNPLAIAMTFRQSGRPLVLERSALRARRAGGTPRLLVLLHGLCMNDLQWQREGHDHGEALARDLGYTPVYLHYNSGLSVSTNGRILAQLLERLYDSWPVPIERMVLMGHGMGGLVARSAFHHGALIQRGGLRWPSRLNDLVCLGTPHQGAPLERAGHGVDVLLSAAPYAPLARLGKLRSAGINDLRLGNVVSAPTSDDGSYRCAQVSLPENVRCFAVAASLGTEAGKPPSDGLVPVASALGQHPDPERRLGFAPDCQAVVRDTGHLDLLSSPAVYALLRQWLG